MDNNMFDNDNTFFGSSLFDNNQETQPSPQPVQQETVQPELVQPKSSAENMALIMNLKDDYTEDEWKARERAYNEEIGKLSVDGYNLTPTDIAVQASKIDSIITPLRLDNLNCSRIANKYENVLKTEKEALFNIVQQSSSTKLTVDQTKSQVVQNIKTTIHHNTGKNLYDLCEFYNYRKYFTDATIRTLQDKKDLLIIYSGILKIENSMSGLSQTVPSQDVFNQMKG